MYDNPWVTTAGLPIDSDMIEGWQGFVYLIRCKENGRLYIGKKNFWTPKTRRLKGKKIRSKIESDWKDYYGSNKELLADVEKMGKDKFERVIIRFCKTKGEMSYYEAKEQFAVDAIIDEKYYNSWIMVRVREDHVNKKTK